MGIVYPCGKAEIESVLPHRDPFLWVSRIIECVPGISAIGELDIDPNLPLFTGHFPEYPVFPGVLLMEALAQTASFSILVNRDGSNLGFFATIDDAKFRNQVRPGDTVKLLTRIVKSSSKLCVAEVEAYVGDTLCCSAKQKYILAPNANQ